MHLSLIHISLGFEFFDEDGNDVGEGAAALVKIEVIRTENKNPLLSGAKDVYKRQLLQKRIRKISGWNRRYLYEERTDKSDDW